MIITLFERICLMALPMAFSFALCFVCVFVFLHQILLVNMSMKASGVHAHTLYFFVYSWFYSFVCFWSDWKCGNDAHLSIQSMCNTANGLVHLNHFEPIICYVSHTLITLEQSNVCSTQECANYAWHPPNPRLFMTSIIHKLCSFYLGFFVSNDWIVIF